MSEQPPAAEQDIEQVWSRVIELVKERLVVPPLWRAMERAKPIVIDGHVLVVGFAAVEDAPHAHLLQDVRYRNVIEQCLAQVFGQELNLRDITGSSIDDWRQIQEIEREKARLRTTGPRAAVAAPAGGLTWESLAEQLTRRYAEWPLRALPSVQAEFLDHAVGEIAKAYPELMRERDPDSEAPLRAYSRVLDRVADRVGVPASMIGFLVVQRRRQSPA